MRSIVQITAVVAGLMLCGFAMGQAEQEPLAPGDLVYVKVFRHPELSTTTQLDESGSVELKYIGNVALDGLTENEASARVRDALKLILKNPRVTVTRSAAASGVPAYTGRTEEMTTRVVPLQNSDAEGLYTALSNMTSVGGSVSHDPDTNSLIITDTPAAVQNILSAVQELDQMRSQITQVHIETRIAEVESEAIKEVGVRWFAQGDNLGGGYYPNPRQSSAVNSLRSFSDPLFNERIENTGRGGTYTGGGRRFIEENDFDRRLAVPVHVPAAGQMFLGYLNVGIDLGVLLDALVADNKAEMLATPYIRTVNHKPATIKMTREVPYTELGSAGLNTVASVQFLDIGIVLDVTPHVRRDPDGTNYVQLELEPEVSTATGVSNGVPVRNVRSSESVANVADGQTLVIGGIIQSDARNVVQEVPGLGKMPLLGSLFRHKERAKKDSELMIFVTPTIYERPEAVTWDRRMPLPEVAEDGDALFGLEPGTEARKE